MDDVPDELGEIEILEAQEKLARLELRPIEEVLHQARHLLDVGNRAADGADHRLALEVAVLGAKQLHVQRQPQRLEQAADVVRSDGEELVPGLQGALRHALGRPRSQQRMDGRQQQLRLHRLRQVRVRAAVQPERAVGIVGEARREVEDGNRPGDRIGLEPLHHVGPHQIRHVDVEDHQGRRAIARDPQGVGAARAFDDVISGALERAPQGEARSLGIVDDGNGFRVHGGRTLALACRSTQYETCPQHARHRRRAGFGG